jgi:hypothetical protein
MADVVVAHTGLGGRTVAVNLEEDGRILASESVEFEGSGGSNTVRIPVTLESAGVRSLTVRVAAQPNEVVPDNNQLGVHIRVRDERDKILYYEGQPRDEVGFLRRAVEDDQNLQVVVLQRTGEDRYVRLDVDSGDELAGGFPRTREELFEYRGLILGSVLPYFESADLNAPALEYLSPVKGPALEQITVEVGSGIRDAASAAELYDRDVEKQAKQLGLPNW